MLAFLLQRNCMVFVYYVYIRPRRPLCLDRDRGRGHVPYHPKTIVVLERFRLRIRIQKTARGLSNFGQRRRKGAVTESDRTSSHTIPVAAAAAAAEVMSPAAAVAGRVAAGDAAAAPERGFASLPAMVADSGQARELSMSPGCQLMMVRLQRRQAPSPSLRR